ncbi:hypothetical protein SDJN02_10440 [Cucurbita argyrosperma subsp. argyrosperma]|nr:hypothetical protein SDJN02_10440 [Cucurbita argyrosperma subsp. argyrosperma]
MFWMMKITFSSLLVSPVPYNSQISAEMMPMESQEPLHLVRCSADDRAKALMGFRSIPLEVHAMATGSEHMQLVFLMPCKSKARFELQRARFEDLQVSYEELM